MKCPRWLPSGCFLDTNYQDDSAAKLIGELLDIARERRTGFVVAGFLEAVEQAREVARGLLAEEKSG